MKRQRLLYVVHAEVKAEAIRILPESLWKELEKTASAKHLNPHQAMRAALLGWIRRTS